METMAELKSMETMVELKSTETTVELEELEKAVDHVVRVYFGDKYLSERLKPLPHGRGGSGFYIVPADVRQQAETTTEPVLLYDPKYVNFRKISHLLLQEQQQDRSAQRQLSHYCYHLYWYADGGKRERIKSLMQQLLRHQNFVDIEAGDLDPEKRHLLWLDPPAVSSGVRPQLLGLLFAVGFLGDLFRRSGRNNFSASEDPECAHSWAAELWSDLLLLENQIPLFRIACPDSDSLVELFRNTGSFFADFVPLNKPKYSRLKGVDRDRNRYLHVLHFVHDMLLPYTIGKSACYCRGFFSKWKEGPARMKPIPTVTRLKSAGVRFKPVDEEGFVVEFKNRVLKLPRLHVSQSTKKMLANLVAWEMCHADAPKYFINYVIFMDYLINTAKDVEILIKSKVIEHSLANVDEVKTFFDGLAEDLVYTQPEKGHRKRYDIFPKLTEDINKYYQSWWMVGLMRKNFKNLSTIISVVAATVLFLFTAFQAYSCLWPNA